MKLKISTDNVIAAEDSEQGSADVCNARAYIQDHARMVTQVLKPKTSKQIDPSLQV